MAKKKKKVSPAVAAIRREIAQYEKRKKAAQGIARTMERKQHGRRIKVLRYAANLLIDFFGD